MLLLLIDVSVADLSLVDGAQECIYFVGNSLGLQPKMARRYIEEELEKWAKMYVTHKIWQKEFNTRQMLIIAQTNFHRGVHGHTEGSRPWAWAENNIQDLMAHVVGKRRSLCLGFGSE